MGTKTVNKLAQKELVVAIRDRYNRSSKSEKSNILNEFTVLSGHHRKHAIRLFRKSVINGSQPMNMIRDRIYDEAVKDALIVLWETSDRICGKRLKAVIPALVEAMERHGHLKLGSIVREKILLVSAATIDRVLRSVRKEAVTRKKKRLFRKLSKTLTTKTCHDWQDSLPGYVEIDFVVHGGGSMSGEYLHSLVVTDVCSGWTEAIPLLAREQSLVIEALKRIQIQMPVIILGINSDNDSAFINDTLSSYCAQAGIVFTHSRVHHSNDQAWIEQKNGAVIRKIVGHERFSGIVAGQAMAQLYQAVRLYVNYFQPSFKLRDRKREGSKVTKKYYAPATPCDRLLTSKDVNEKVKDVLRKKREPLDPVALLQRIRQGQSALASLSSGTSSTGPDQQSLNQFLARLPQLWREGEVRPTHRKSEGKTRWWRTRAEPFKDVWTEILLWLQSNPDCTAKSLFFRLKETYPEKFTKGQLRTLQRRIKEWRHTMARHLVFDGINDINTVGPVAVDVPVPV